MNILTVFYNFRCYFNKKLKEIVVFITARKISVYLVRIPLLSGYSCEILLLNYASDSLLQNHVI